MSSRSKGRRGNKRRHPPPVENLGTVNDLGSEDSDTEVDFGRVVSKRPPPSVITRPRDGRMNQNVEKKTSGGSSFLLVACFFGIFCSYLVYGLLQESITKRSFGDDRFYYFMFLVFCQCIVNAFVAASVNWYQGNKLSIAPYGLFLTLSFSYVGAMVASNSSLAFISYPTQVLGKSAKPIPVLLLGVLLGRKSYPLIKYLCVLLIVTGVAIFLYKDRPSKQNAAKDDQWRILGFVGIGELLVLVSLMLDGVTGVLQDKLRALHNTQALQMMFAVNILSPIYLIPGMLYTGEAVEAVQFISNHPEIIPNIFVFCISSAVGQLFIFLTIVNFGPLVCSIITTTRKFFTILASIVIFSNALLPRQWVGMLLVFSGLGIDVYQGKKKQTAAQRNTQPV